MSPFRVEAFYFKGFALMAKYPKDYLEKTIQLFQPYSEALLSLDDAQEIADNALDLYAYLIELKERHER
ncbi:MAG: hypothetical protein HQL24_09995 [Candidatus Omnitrophica bacterium]|nr:hypothetical protein [Candidatus Omnitrophota bacterium]